MRRPEGLHWKLLCSKPLPGVPRDAAEEEEVEEEEEEEEEALEVEEEEEDVVLLPMLRRLLTPPGFLSLAMGPCCPLGARRFSP